MKITAPLHVTSCSLVYALNRNVLSSTDIKTAKRYMSNDMNLLYVLFFGRPHLFSLGL